MFDPIEIIEEQKLRKGFDVNVFGPIAVTKAFLPLLREFNEQRKGESARIVFIGSVAGLVTFPYMGAYCASKYAVEAIADGLRRELVPWGIRVSLIEPGSFMSKIAESVPGTLQELEGEEADTNQQQQQQQQTGQSQAATTRISLYRKKYSSFLKMVESVKSKLPNPAPVAIQLERVLFAKFPPARALVGQDALAMPTISSALPDSVTDLACRFL